MKKIFFSWQSDNSTARNKIKRALEIAVKQIGDELQEAERPELDSDIQGIFSSDEITATIFKKIEKSSAFVADVTPVSAVGDKLIPNPNVMLELGYALKSIGTSTSIFIYCSDDTRAADKMPFDIKTKALIRVDPRQQSSELAIELVKRLKGILDQEKDITEENYPNIYVSGASFTQGSDMSVINMQLKNTEPVEYFLSAIEIEGLSSEPKRGLTANDITPGIVLNNVTQVFKSSKPLVKMTVSAKRRTYHLEQEITVRKGADEQYHFVDFVHRATLAYME